MRRGRPRRQRRPWTRWMWGSAVSLACWVYLNCLDASQIQTMSELIFILIRAVPVTIAFWCVNAHYERHYHDLRTSQEQRDEQLRVHYEQQLAAGIEEATQTAATILMNHRKPR